MADVLAKKKVFRSINALCISIALLKKSNVTMNTKNDFSKLRQICLKEYTKKLSADYCRGQSAVKDYLLGLQ